MRLAVADRIGLLGKRQPRANNTVRLELGSSGIFIRGIKEWGVGLPSNPVMNIRRPAPGPGRNRRMAPEEEASILSAMDAHFESDAWLDRAHCSRNKYVGVVCRTATGYK